MTISPIRCTVVGIGGIGTALADGLAKALQFQAPGSALVLVDGDNFEEKNRERQSFKAMGNKAHSKRDELVELYPNIFVLSRAAWVVSPAIAEKAEDEQDEQDNIISKISADSLMSDGCVVFAVVDNHAARKLVIEAAARQDNVDVYTGGNGAPETGDGLEGSIYHYQRRNGKDTTLHPFVMHKEMENPQDKNPGELSCQQRAELDGGTQVHAANLTVAALLLGKFSQVTFGTEEEKARALECAEQYFDLVEGAVVSYDRRPEDIIVPESESNTESVSV